jgi:hypothetical protein
MPLRRFRQPPGTCRHSVRTFRLGYGALFVVNQAQTYRLFFIRLFVKMNSGKIPAGWR